MLRLGWTLFLIATLLCVQAARGETVKSADGAAVEFKWDGAKYVPADPSWTLNPATGYYERKDAVPTYGSLYAEAVKESKPLVVWIGYKCPSSAVQVPGMVHYHAPGNSWEKWDRPGVVVSVPGGDGSMYFAEFIGAADCCATNIKAAVERTLQRWERQTARANTSAAFKHVRGWAASTNGQCVG